MLTKADKIKVVEELSDRLGRQKVSIFATIRGTSVAKLSQFRRDLRKVGAEFRVAKKTLLDRALKSAGPAFSGIDPKSLEGELGVVFGFEDQALPAKITAKFSKENETFKILKGILEGKILESRDVAALARLPGREELLSQVARAMNAPVQGIVNVLQGNIRNFVVVLNQIKGKK